MNNMMDFPQEILSLIASHTKSTKDLIQCLRVCYSWNLAFQPYLYHKICFRNRRQFRHFKNAITSKPNGLYVKHIRFEDDLGLSSEEFDMLSMLLPNAESIYFHPRVWKYQHAPNTTSYWNRLTELPPMIDIPLTYTILKMHGQKLESLTLTAGLVNQIQSTHKLVNLLESTPNLKSLRIIGYNKEQRQRAEFSLTDLLNIHFCLQELQHLDLSDVTLTQMNLTEIQKAIAEPMKYLTVKSFYLLGSVCDVHWMTFFASVYPNISKLILNATWNPSYKNRMTLDDKEVVKQALANIGRDYHALKQIRIGDISGAIKLADQAFFNSISNHCRTKLTTLDCTQTSIQNTSKETYDALVRCNNFNLSTLKLQLWRDVVSFEKVMSSLSHNHLEDLELTCGKYSFSWKYGCEIDTILMHCPRLKSLKLTTARMTKVGHTNKIISGLQSLVLHKVHFSTEAFDVIANSCPELSNLQLDNCVKEKDKLSQQILIALPNTQLERLVIDQIYLRPNSYIEKSSIDSAFLALDLMDRDEKARKRHKVSGKMTRVYHLSNKSKGTLHTRSLSRLDPQDAYSVQSYTMTERDWDQLQENSIRGTYREHKHWRTDVPYGYVHIQLAFRQYFYHIFPSYVILSD